MSTSSIKRQIRRFHVVVVQWTSKKCTKKRDARAELLFWSLNLLFFWSRRCGRRRSCLSSLISISTPNWSQVGFYVFKKFAAEVKYCEGSFPLNWDAHSITFLAVKFHLPHRLPFLKTVFSCSLLLSNEGSTIETYNTESSINNRALQLRLDGKIFIYIRKSRGPMSVHCETPDVSSLDLVEKFPSHTTRWYRSVRKLLIQSDI